MVGREHIYFDQDTINQWASKIFGFRRASSVSLHTYNTFVLDLNIIILQPSQVSLESHPPA